MRSPGTNAVFGILQRFVLGGYGSFNTTYVMTNG